MLSISTERNLPPQLNMPRGASMMVPLLATMIGVGALLPAREAPPESQALSMAITVSPANVSDRVSSHMYGSGIETYNHGMYGGLWSNMLFDDSVEDAAKGALPELATRTSWFSAGSGACSVQPGGMNGKQSLLLEAKGSAAVNRGLVVAADVTSMHFVGKQPYEGYVFLNSSSKATVRVSLLCTALGSMGTHSTWRTLGSVDLTTTGQSTELSTPGMVPAGWDMHNFTIMTAADCLHAGTGASAGQGMILVSLLDGANVRIDKMMVEPGEWGRWQGMHVRKDLAEAILAQGITMMRLGGSMTNHAGFRFKYMVGPAWSRPPTDSGWIAHTSWGFGMFEFLEFNERAGLQIYLCINFSEDMPGLLEYLYGGENSTWGAQRVADGHPAKYSNEIVFICSNEEPQQACNGKYSCYIKAFSTWVSATKSAAIALGVWPLTIGVTLDSGAGRFFNPTSEDPYKGGATEMMEAIKAAELGDARVLWDQHGDGGVAAGWGDQRDWQKLLSDVPPSPNSMEALSQKVAGRWIKTVMLEENGGGCGLSRALGHVSNSISFQRFGHQMVAQSAAGIMWPGEQGATNGDYQIKFLADRIVKAPYWHAQQMLSESHQPNVVGGYHTGLPSLGKPTAVNTYWADWMAAVADDGKTLVIRTENPNSLAVSLSATIAAPPRKGGQVWAEIVEIRTLAGDSLSAVNDYDTPDKVSPKNSTASLTGGGTILGVTLPPYSFCVFTLRSVE